jgi:peptidoglycan hydrolase-like protein with peptidoglycan-binding domain
MKKFVFISLVLALGVYLFGCGKKQQTLEEMQQPMSMETLTTMNTTASVAPQAQEVKAPEAKVETVTSPAAKTGKLEPLPPPGPYKPTGIEIQTALKNANLYTGEIDGKIGPKTKKAIIEFQKANGLTADGKVGPKTWSVLSSHLNVSPAPADTSKSR